jgi:prepilin-type N-terminal cleavage/methylation domain-containing protein
MLLLKIKKYLKKENAFSLIEIVVVIAISGFVVVALSTLFNSSLRLRSSNRNYLAAVSLSEDIIERIRSIPFEDTSPPNILDLYSKLPNNDNKISYFYSYLDIDTNTIYSLEQIPSNVLNFSNIQIIYQNNGELAGSYLVDLKIKWKNDMEPYQIVTSITKGGLNDYINKF